MSMLKVVDLGKRYGENVILENVSLEVDKGEVVSIIGPSGAGKSTLLRAINQLDPPTSGQVYLDGERISRQNVNRVRRKMGMVFQSVGLFSHLNVMDNLCAGPMKLLDLNRAEAEEKALKLLRTVGLSERTRHFPAQLSGGQRQRVAIARCLAMEPQLILFDEPTSALDPTMVGEVMAVIRGLAQTGLTMMIVTHEMNFAKEVSSRVLYMDERGLYEQGTSEEIFERPKRPKTQAFIYKIRSYQFEIRSRDFDNVAMLSGIDQFCFAHAVDPVMAKKLRLVAEELVINLVAPRFGQGELTISASASLGRYAVSVAYPGEKTNVLDAAGDELALRLIRGTASEVAHVYQEGVNRLTLTL